MCLHFGEDPNKNADVVNLIVVSRGMLELVCLISRRITQKLLDSLPRNLVEGNKPFSFDADPD